MLGKPDEVLQKKDKRWQYEDLDDFREENPEWKKTGENDELYIYEYDDPSYDETVYIKFIGDEISFICYKFYK